MIRFFRLLGWDDPFMTRGGLARIAGVILLASFLVAWATAPEPRSETVIAGAMHTLVSEGYAEAEAGIVRWLEDHPADAATWQGWVQLRAAVLESDDPPKTLHLDEAEFRAFLETSTDPGPAILGAWYDYYREDLETALARLEPVDTAPKWRTQGALLEMEGRLEEAVPAYEKALELDPALEGVRASIFQAHVALGNVGRANELLEDEAYRDEVHPWDRAELRYAAGDWGSMVRDVMAAELEVHTWDLLVPALVVGFAWYLVAMNLGWSWKWKRSSRVVAGVAFGLGYLSAVALMPMILVQNHIFEKIGPSIPYNLFYCVVVIGLKEEAIKLLFLVPLVPLLARSGSNLRILTTASLVGLGFAVNENILYYLTEGGTEVLGRFLTANFAHMVLTGYAGYYLVKAVQKGGEEWLWFGSEATKMVVVHGVYDWLIMEPAAGELSFFAMLVFIVLSQMYLRLVMDIAPSGRRPVPLTRLFVAALALATGVGYILASRSMGLRLAFLAIASGFVGIVIITFMFFRVFDEDVR